MKFTRLIALLALLLPLEARATTYAPVYTGQLTNLSTTVGSSSAQAIAAAASRKYLILQNVSAVNIACSPFGAATVGSAGTFTLIPNASFVFESSAVATNAWFCIAASGSGNGLSVAAIQ